EQTKAAIDHSADFSKGLGKPRRIAVMLATLFGKVSSLEQVSSLLDRLGVQTISGYDVRGATLSILRERFSAEQLYEARATDGEIRRLSRRVEIDLLVRVAKAWLLASKEPGAAADWLIERARSLGVAQTPPAPVLLGRRLVELGIPPGP